MHLLYTVLGVGCKSWNNRYAHTKEDTMNERVDNWLVIHQNDMVRDLRGCLSIHSLKSKAAPGAPFGRDIQDCLDYTLKLADEMGFLVKDHEGYYGSIEMGEGDETFGILVHLDIVPIGEGWTFDPLGKDLVDGKLYGRGALDDKGPAIAALYAMKAVSEAGIPLRRKVRLILGCDEESGMQCMEYFKKHDVTPDLSISPDGEFPLTNSEKSIVNAVFERRFQSSITVSAGEAANVVPGEAVAFVPIPLADVKDIAESFGNNSDCSLVLTAKDGGTHIKVIGSIAHASMPEEGLNALQSMFCFLSLLPLEKDDMAIVLSLKEKFKMEYYGQSIGLDKADVSGRLTLNMGVVRWDETGFALTFDLRCPTSLSSEGIKKALCDAMEPTGALLKHYLFKPGYSLAEDSEIVSKLLNVFKARTGLDLPPKKIGGGTYARTLPNAVSFGPDGYLCESSAHVADEFITIEQLLFNAKILADAIIALAG